MAQTAQSILEPQSALMVDWIANPDGSIKVVWEDGHSNSFLNLEEVQAHIASLGSDNTVSERLLLAWFLARQPAGGNVNIVEGKRLTFDLSAANPIRVQ